MNLFQHSAFRSHAGRELTWKIECDALTDDDIECLAHQLLRIVRIRGITTPRFIGIPRGGIRLASAMNRLANVAVSSDKSQVIVDDVYTTGMSMQQAMDQHGAVFGVVLFTRMLQPMPSNVQALFHLHPWLCERNAP